MDIFIILHGRRTLHSISGPNVGDLYVYTSPLCKILGLGKVKVWSESFLEGTIPSALLTKMDTIVYKAECDPNGQKCVPAKYQV